MAGSSCTSEAWTQQGFWYTGLRMMYQPGVTLRPTTLTRVPLKMALVVSKRGPGPCQQSVSLMITVPFTGVPPGSGVPAAPPLWGMGAIPVGSGPAATPCAVAVITALVCRADRVMMYMVGLEIGETLLRLLGR